MMSRFPLFRPQFSPFRYYYLPNYYTKNSDIDENIPPCKDINNEQKENSKTKESAVFELFGIKLYADDILILSLLIVLYTEGIQDQELFLVLLLLLLS